VRAPQERDPRHAAAGPAAAPDAGRRRARFADVAAALVPAGGEASRAPGRAPQSRADGILGRRPQSSTSGIDHRRSARPGSRSGRRGVPGRAVGRVGPAHPGHGARGAPPASATRHGMTSPFSFDTVERLVSRIIAGESVFFVGAGFSLDSEPNSSGRLIRRLMARFAAMTEVLTAPPPDGADPTRATVSRADGLRRGLRVTFGLGDRELTSEEMVAPSTIEKLTPVYYNINDWICSAFTILLRDLEGTSPTVRAAIRHREAALLKNEGGAAPYDQIPLEDFDVETLAQLGGAGGKALFLETMGFGSAEIWGGDPRAPRSVDALRSYGGRLRERHHVIARLAREGVVPLIITTNFDLLLEGACREAGFEIGDPGETDPAKPWAG